MQHYIVFLEVCESIQTHKPTSSFLHIPALTVALSSRTVAVASALSYPFSV